MPWTTVVAGTTITAAWSNANNRDQVITPFASAAARDSAITSPIEGQYAHLNDTNKLTHYNGTVWVSANNNIIARQVLTSNSALFTTNATTDFVLSSVVVFATRLYAVHLHSSWGITAADSWNINFHVDGTLTDRLYDINTPGAVVNNTADGSVLWEPTSGTKNLDVRVAGGVSGGDLQFNGAAGSGRWFWVEDVGPR